MRITKSLMHSTEMCTSWIRSFAYILAAAEVYDL
jgi:hypothetical protein